ncbi:hypothetical protein J2X61_003202 [Bacillus sp. 3255]|uniref:hypothetical protein n=1 Tax=unclassified Paenibacillus TaxID=185978 RepID=UPI002378EF7B|nr:hypothetical protein [Paenibacillus sp. MAHUQ-63]MDR6881440.1 hypothetical protein [Bacillus sp. 3255]
MDAGLPAGSSVFIVKQDIDCYVESLIIVINSLVAHENKDYVKSITQVVEKNELEVIGR